MKISVVHHNRYQPLGQKMDTKNLPKNATFFISTGRCATQWMTDKLSTHYHDLAVVKHEPFQVEYKPRFYFNAYHRKEEVNLSQTIEEHLSFIRNTIQNFSYEEMGSSIKRPFVKE